jgi:dTDP-glucose 4,6-dehydratase
MHEVISSSKLELLKLDGAKILILGGTGFVGKWLVSTLIAARLEFHLDYEISIVTRFPQKSFALFNDSRINFIKHDLASGTLKLPNADYFVHGSTPSVANTGAMNLQNVASATLNGTISISNAISAKGAIGGVTFLSSGAVYGHQSANMSHLPERPAESPNPSLTVYGQTKLANEILIAQMKSNFGTPVSTPRLFAFYGPHIALDEHFAIGNFIRDARAGGPIKVLGNSQTTRSYMYPTDLIKCLLRLITHPQGTPINLGSDQALTMKQIAEHVSAMFKETKIDFLGEDKPPSNYVPATPWMHKMGPNSSQVTFIDGLHRWISWLDSKV